MKNQIVILFLIIILVFVGFYFLEDKPVVSNEIDDPYIPREEIEVPKPKPCTQDGVIVECKS